MVHFISQHSTQIKCLWEKRWGLSSAWNPLLSTSLPPTYCIFSTTKRKSSFRTHKYLFCSQLRVHTNNLLLFSSASFFQKRATDTWCAQIVHNQHTQVEAHNHHLPTHRQPTPCSPVGGEGHPGGGESEGQCADRCPWQHTWPQDTGWARDVPAPEACVQTWVIWHWQNMRCNADGFYWIYLTHLYPPSHIQDA